MDVGITFTFYFFALLHLSLFTSSFHFKKLLNETQPFPYGFLSKKIMWTAFDHSRILDLGTQHSQLSTTEFVLALHKEFNSVWVCSVQAEYVQLVLGVCEARWTGSGRLDNQHIE